MGNPCHLALETPQPNLGDGMRWRQGTFGICFNAFPGERGHVFQSRDKSLVIEGRLAFRFGRRGISAAIPLFPGASRERCYRAS